MAARDVIVVRSCFHYPFACIQPIRAIKHDILTTSRELVSSYVVCCIEMSVESSPSIGEPNSDIIKVVMTALGLSPFALLLRRFFALPLDVLRAGHRFRLASSRSSLNHRIW